MAGERVTDDASVTRSIIARARRRVPAVAPVVVPTTVAGLALFGTRALRWDVHLSGTAVTKTALLAVGVFAGELLPVTIPRREGDEQITFSTTFAFALALLAGFAPAAGCLGLASVLQDALARKPWWRVLFNVAQYTLSLAAATFAMHAVAGLPHAHGAVIRDGDLPAIVLGGLLFFGVNYCVVGAAVALHLGWNPLVYLKRELGFTTLTGAVLLAMAPIVLAAIAFAPLLFPVLLIPLIAIYRGSRQAAEREHAANHDSLTALVNRSAFRDSTERLLEDPSTQRAAVMLMDLNRFKEINDTLGHHYGDQLLREVAERLSEELREGEVLARLGGDEFGIAIADPPSTDAIRSVADRLLAALAEPFEFDGITLEVSASIGAARHPEDGDGVDDLLQHADVAMYLAKGAHEGYMLYSSEFDRHSPAQLALTADLRTAVAVGQLVLHYQPQVDTQTGRMVGVEGLARWRHPALGELSPDAFIPLAERTGLIKALTTEVLRIALEQHVAWRREGRAVRVAVNVSARSLLDRSFAAQVADAVARHGVDPHFLTVEVTESMIMADPALARATLAEISALGTQISIDDFGTGYSSLSHLTQLPVDEVKLDRSFVQKMCVAERDAEVVRSVVQLGLSLGLTVVAEGVEDEATLCRLAELGAQVVQGYYVSRPLEPAHVGDWLRSHPEREPALLPPRVEDARSKQGVA